jgi:hypothetical protein
MSADNGIYILKTNKPYIREGNILYWQDGHDYRVTYCTNIEDIDYSHLYLPVLFGDSLVFSSYEQAFEYAEKLSLNYDYLEYGISMVTRSTIFPNMTRAAALKALDCYVGATPLDFVEE